ncbi:MAG TPA: RraA family protein [Burkholderiales bacterium]|nr:RraA family protein [Burkholderiales bacterium]
MNRNSVRKIRASIRARYLKVDTATVADVLDVLGLRDQGLAPQFAPYPANAGTMGGWAYTLRGKMTRYAGEGDPRKMRAVDGVGPGEIAVWSGEGRGVCFFGELIALGMKRRGCAGALVDGGIRDIEWIRRQRFPVYARYRTPVQSIGRWRVTAWQVPVELPGATSRRVRVNPGDFVLADTDGVIVVPERIALRALAEAERLTAREIRIRRDLGRGASLEDVLKKYGHV